MAENFVARAESLQVLAELVFEQPLLACCLGLDIKRLTLRAVLEQLAAIQLEPGTYKIVGPPGRAGADHSRPVVSLAVLRIGPRRKSPLVEGD